MVATRPRMKAPARIETARLVLRRPTFSDAGPVFERYASDPHVTRFLGWPRHRSVVETEAFLQFSRQEWERWPAGPYPDPLTRERPTAREHRSGVPVTARGRHRIRAGERCLGTGLRDRSTLGRARCCPCVQCEPGEGALPPGTPPVPTCAGEVRVPPRRPADAARGVPEPGARGEAGRALLRVDAGGTEGPDGMSGRFATGARSPPARPETSPENREPTTENRSTMSVWRSRKTPASPVAWTRWRGFSRSTAPILSVWRRIAARPTCSATCRRPSA